MKLCAVFLGAAADGAVAVRMVPLLMMEGRHAAAGHPLQHHVAAAATCWPLYR